MTDTEYNALVRYMRTARTLTPAQVQEKAEKHAPLVRYGARQGRPVPSAH
jgi:hypothetical protein